MSDELAECALRLARSICEDVRSRLQDGANTSTDWSLAGGYAGISIAFDRLDRIFPAEGWDFAAKRCLSAGVDQLCRFSDEGTEPSLFGGLSGLAFAALELSRGGVRYTNLIQTLHANTITLGRKFIANTREQSELAAADYDLISGVTGIGAYTFASSNLPGGPDLLDDCLAFFTDLPNGQSLINRLTIPGRLVASQSIRESCAEGYVDCGLAHGVPGPLSLMSSALIAGSDRTGLRDTVRATAQWLMDRQLSTENGKSWPAFIASPMDGTKGHGATASRVAWCYGNPGVARSLWLAGRALKEQLFLDASLDAIESVYNQARADWQIDSPMFCHGLAGLLQVTLRFACDLPIASKHLVQGASQVLEELLSSTSSGGDLLMRSDSPKSAAEQNGLLEGDAGVVLSLLAAASEYEPTWDRAFLLS